MASFRSFEEIEAWKRARSLTNQIYQASGKDRFAKDFGLKDQIRRASVSVLSNIAEGFQRGGNKEFIQFLSIAKGSIGEVKSQLYVALDQGYIDEDTRRDLSSESDEIQRMISGLIKYLRASKYKGYKFK
jgi:four helix bundle protein